MTWNTHGVTDMQFQGAVFGSVGVVRVYHHDRYFITAMLPLLQCYVLPKQILKRPSKFPKSCI